MSAFTQAPHLSDAQLLEVVRGADTLTPEQLQHLESCQTCRSSGDFWRAAHRTASHDLPVSTHRNDDELSAWVLHPVGPLAAHMRTCPDCQQQARCLGRQLQTLGAALAVDRLQALGCAPLDGEPELQDSIDELVIPPPPPPLKPPAPSQPSGPATTAAADAAAATASRTLPGVEPPVLAPVTRLQAQPPTEDTRHPLSSPPPAMASSRNAPHLPQRNQTGQRLKPVWISAALSLLLVGLWWQARPPESTESLPVPGSPEPAPLLLRGETNPARELNVRGQLYRTSPQGLQKVKNLAPEELASGCQPDDRLRLSLTGKGQGSLEVWTRNRSGMLQPLARLGRIQLVPSPQELSGQRVLEPGAEPQPSGWPLWGHETREVLVVYGDLPGEGLTSATLTEALQQNPPPFLIQILRCQS